MMGNKEISFLLYQNIARIHQYLDDYNVDSYEFRDYINDIYIVAEINQLNEMEIQAYSSLFDYEDNCQFFYSNSNRNYFMIYNPIQRMNGKSYHLPYDIEYFLQEDFTSHILSVEKFIELPKEFNYKDKFVFSSKDLLEFFDKMVDDLITNGGHR